MTLWFNPNASAWVRRWAGLIPSGGRVLDLACGGGRHAVYLAELGHEVVAVDRDLSLVNVLRDTPRITWRQADLEAGAWPFPDEAFRGIVVTNYLHRPLFAPLLAALQPGGLLIYETFSIGQAKYGRPRNPAHLLLSGELLEIARGALSVLGFEDVEEPEQRRCVQRLCALKP